MSALRGDGLLAVGNFPNARPRQLLQVFQGAYGLTEAPRLCHLGSRPADGTGDDDGVHESRPW